MYFCQTCRMQVDDIRSHREVNHPEPPYNDGKTYTLTEAAQALREQECRFHGHSWDTVSVVRSEFPVAIVCGNCGLSRSISVQEPAVSPNAAHT